MSFKLLSLLVFDLPIFAVLSLFMMMPAGGGQLTNSTPEVATHSTVGNQTSDGKVSPSTAAATAASGPVCAQCHGVDGNSPNPMWPNLAGQNQKYLYYQLKLFKDKTRKDPLMTPQAMALTDQEMKEWAQYFQSQKPHPMTAEESLVELGRNIYRGGNLEKGVPACSSCHGAQGFGNPAAGFPRVSFQHMAYVDKRLKEYRQGIYNSYDHGKMMHQVVSRLNDHEIEAVSSYLQGLH